jgi:hypothetical protein
MGSPDLAEILLLLNPYKSVLVPLKDSPQEMKEFERFACSLTAKVRADVKSLLEDIGRKVKIITLMNAVGDELFADEKREAAGHRRKLAAGEVEMLSGFETACWLALLTSKKFKLKVDVDLTDPEAADWSRIPATLQFLVEWADFFGKDCIYDSGIPEVTKSLQPEERDELLRLNGRLQEPGLRKLLDDWSQHAEDGGRSNAARRMGGLLQLLDYLAQRG